ncbi:MAG: GntR family transcriptional regulator [Bacteroides sp.]|nr:GntR family transcriptional regulator [Bacteroides sp.]MCM1379810.1 GntR family transcriptional regulator [Bacteroides sp.]MCM1446169.1 GntR family transcriptional regulator [Prevotella sp.]
MEDIRAGRYAADSRIPSVRDVAASAQVNVNTAMRTFEHLEREGIIYNKRGIGYFVSPDAPAKISARLKENFFNNEMNYFFARLEQLEMSPVDLLRHYETYLNLKNDNPN